MVFAIVFLTMSVSSNLNSNCQIAAVGSLTTVTTYYVDATAGSDSNTGTSIDKPWQTLAKVSATTLNPGDQVLLKRGSVWNETLTLASAGTVSNPIVIDAYNFIKQISSKQFVSDQEIRDWVDKFKEYVRLKNNEILLVFDAGPSIGRSQESHGNVKIIYSGQKQSADDVIKEWLDCNKECDVLLVTSDRDIRYFAEQLNIISVGSLDFYKIFNSVFQREVKYEQKIVHTLHKITDVQSQELDLLMEKSSRCLNSDIIHRDEIVPIRIRNGKKVAKQDKKILKKLEKI